MTQQLDADESGARRDDTARRVRHALAPLLWIGPAHAR